ncbi:hypothetical protein [Haladaptatus sp. NG-WS-4]
MAQQYQQQPEPQRGIGQQSESQRYRPMGQQGQQPTQQSQQPTQQYQQPGQQSQQQPGQVGQQIRERYEESVPSEVRLAVDDLEKVATTAEWAKMKAVHRGLPRVANVCDDIEELAEFQKKLIIRQSPFSQTVGQCTTQAIQQGLQELQQHADEPAVQDTIEHARQSLDTIHKGLSRLQTQGMQQSGQQMGQQVGGQQMGQQGGRQQTGGQQFGGQQVGGQQSGGQFQSQRY